VETVSATVQQQVTSVDHLPANQNILTQSVIALETSAEEVQATLSDKVTMLTSDVRALENRLLRLVPLLAQLKRGSGASSPLILNNGVPDRFQDRLETCEQTNSVLNDLVSTLQEEPTQTASMPSSAMEAPVLELQTQMKQLQLKVVGKGVQIWNKTFQSLEDVKVWVSAQPPNHRYGLFVDGVSLFEFFSAGHIDAEPPTPPSIANIILALNPPLGQEWHLLYKISFRLSSENLTPMSIPQMLFQH
jgi:hypothetical protein